MFISRNIGWREIYFNFTSSSFSLPFFIFLFSSLFYMSINFPFPRIYLFVLSTFLGSTYNPIIFFWTLVAVCVCDSFFCDPLERFSNKMGIHYRMKMIKNHHTYPIVHLKTGLQASGGRDTKSDVWMGLGVNVRGSYRISKKLQALILLASLIYSSVERDGWNPLLWLNLYSLLFFTLK